MVNIEPNATNVDESIVKRVEPDPLCSLIDHLHPLRTFSQSYFDLLLIPKGMTF